MASRRTIAVLFGGRSVEHDVSVLTGIQFLEALDQSRYTGLPLYVDPDGQWWSGALLRKRSLYPLSVESRVKLDAVTLPVGVRREGGPHLLTMRKSLFGAKTERIDFDLLVPAIHGSNGEDGSLQGLLAFEGIPFAGSRALGAAATMDKHFTKEALRALGLPILPHVLLDRPAAGAFLDRARLKAKLEARLGADPLPLIVKPRRLGSSVGVAIARDFEALEAALSAAFRLDNCALIEPLVPDLVEYNIAVMRQDGAVRTSAIERPLATAEMLDFSAKYLAGSTGGSKLDEAPSEGMVSLNRELNPQSLAKTQESLIRSAAITAFEHFDLAGSVRIDFLGNGKTGELWLNEINSIPGSFAWFLWQAAAKPLGFTALATAIVEEGFAFQLSERGDRSATGGKAQIFRRD